MQVETQGVDAGGIDLVSVEHFPEYAIGLPVWVAITVRAHSDTSFHGLAFADLAGTRSCIGIEMIGPAGARKQMPKPVVDTNAARRPQSLAAGETRRMLVDISSLAGPDLTEGEYHIRLSFLSPELSVTGKPFTARFRKPTATEEALLALIPTEKRRYPDWNVWMRECRGHALPLSRIPDSSPAALTFVLNYLFCGTEPVASISPESLDAFAGIPAPERKALQAELLFARGDTGGVARLREAILAETPGLAWWLGKVGRGAGFLKTFGKRPQ